MFKKMAIGLLLVTVLGAGGAAAAYGSSTMEAQAATETTVAVADAAAQQAGQGYGAVNGQGQQGNQGAQGEREIAAEGAVGDPWNETGTIIALDDTGFDFSLESGEMVYVELGPADYWQTQGVMLEAGQTVTVDGSINEGMIHATTITLADGQVLVVRSETGQPLWSGGADHEQGQNGVDDGTGQAQIEIDEWITIEGTLMSFQGGNMTMSAADGSLLSFRTGQPRFFAEQGITFSVGDEVVVVGFYQDGEFQAGDITQVSTGARVMLRDPNGRPLWAGPGNGNGNGGK